MAKPMRIAKTVLDALQTGHLGWYLNAYISYLKEITQKTLGLLHLFCFVFLLTKCMQYFETLTGWCICTEKDGQASE